MASLRQPVPGFDMNAQPRPMAPPAPQPGMPPPGGAPPGPPSPQLRPPQGPPAPPPAPPIQNPNALVGAMAKKVPQGPQKGSLIDSIVSQLIQQQRG